MRKRKNPYTGKLVRELRLRSGRSVDDVCKFLKCTRKEWREIERRSWTKPKAPIGYHWCANCQMHWPESNFHKNRASKYGLADYCKPCACARKRGRVAARKVKEKIQREPEVDEMELPDDDSWATA